MLVVESFPAGRADNILPAGGRMFLQGSLGGIRYTAFSTLERLPDLVTLEMAMVVMEIIKDQLTYWAAETGKQR